jgi:AAA15 family ATPase/GTPase
MLPVLQGIIPQYTPTLIAKWEVKSSEDVISVDITAPYSMTSIKKPYKTAKFVDLLSHTTVVETVQIYGSLKRESLLDEVTEKMREIYPEIQGFDMIPYPDGSQAPVSVVKNDGKILPLYAFGDGVQRWFYILGIMILYKNSIICIDEIDTGLHYKAQAEFSVNLVDYALKNGVQLFVTTHNIEFVDAFLDAVNDKRNDKMDKIRIITLKDTVDGITSRTMNAREAVEVRGNYNLELR